MSYSGNPSLSSDVKQRILSTFDQTVQLAQEGNRQEALLGCDFVLRMDPQFQPAHILQERLRSGDGPVRVDDLTGGPAIEALPDDPFADLDPVSLGLPDQLPDDGASFLRDELQTLLEQRRFQDLLATAEREQSTIALHPELRRIVGSAQERLEAEPYVLKFLESARQAVQAGQDDEVGRLLDKARSLDPDHPGIATLERKRGATSVAPPPALEIPAPFPTTTMPVSLDFMVGDSESDRRIQELLAEGQTAFDAGDPQSAIDAWSRIFLIDIDHQEASRRIEAARKLKAESERQVEEIFHDGLARLEAGDSAGARQAFQRVLEIQPAYFAAREYLQQLDAGSVPSPRAAAREAAPAAGEPARAFPAETGVPSQELKEEILVPPEPGERPVQAPERPAKRMVAARDGSRARRLFLLIGGAVLALALAGGWFALQNWDRLFPNAQEEAPPPALSQDPIARAERLHRAGKTAIALNQLRRIPPADPHYPQAQKLIAQWGGAPAASTAAPPAPGPGQAPAQPPVAASPENERRQALLAAARAAYAEASYLKAMRRLEQAGTIAKLDGEDARLLADTKQKLAPLANQIEYFRQHEWEHILRELWIRHDKDPGNRDVTQLLVDCSYNLAVRDLQRNDASKAAAWLEDAVKLHPEDAVLRRHYLFAQTYEQRQKDLLYKIYVKYLPYR